MRISVVDYAVKYFYRVAIWNFMGSSTLLAMPWAIMMSGLVLGPLLVLAMGLITWATAMVILQLHKRKSTKKFTL